MCSKQLLTPYITLGKLLGTLGESDPPKICQEKGLAWPWGHAPDDPRSIVGPGRMAEKGATVAEVPSLRHGDRTTVLTSWLNALKYPTLLVDGQYEERSRPMLKDSGNEIMRYLGNVVKEEPHRQSPPVEY